MTGGRSPAPVTGRLVLRVLAALVALVVTGTTVGASAAGAGPEGGVVARGWDGPDGIAGMALAVTARPLAPACGTASRSLVDVPFQHPHHPGISCLYLWDVTTGTSSGRYAPDQPVTRAQMATFIVRVLAQAGVALPASPSRAFSDVIEGATHSRAIDQLAALEIVTGDGGRYRPGAGVGRGQMASFLMRTAAMVAGSPLPVGGDAFFDDNGTVHEDNINRAAEAGVATGTSGASFSPGATVTRAQMGSFLARLLSLLVERYEVPTRATSGAPPTGPLYRFIVAPGEFGNTQPARWDPCVSPTIPWRIQGHADPAWVALVSDAFAAANAATGLQATRDQGFTGSRRIDVDFQPSSAFPQDVVGLASFEIEETSAGEPELRAGHISFNADFMKLVTGPQAGELAREAARIVTLHEVAHVFGLGHVDDPRLLMAEGLDPALQDPAYGPGELEGLGLVGASQGCLPR